MPAEKKEKTCFTIMPISTPEHMIEKYNGDSDHFKHVLKCLHEVAIQEAGYKPLSPIAKGSDLIHAEIIKNLETADMVLCDISCLNPNVFFEFGIRTSLDKPITIVKDEFVEKIPFDAGILNIVDYKSTLNAWELKTEVKTISDQIKHSAKNSKGQNTLWKYFGLKSKAEPFEGGTGVDDKLDYLTMRIDSMQRNMGNSNYKRKDRISLTEKEMREIYDYISESYGKILSPFHLLNRDGRIEVNYGSQLTTDAAKLLTGTLNERFSFPIKLYPIKSS